MEIITAIKAFAAYGLRPLLETCSRASFLSAVAPGDETSASTYAGSHQHPPRPDARANVRSGKALQVTTLSATARRRRSSPAAPPRRSARLAQRLAASSQPLHGHSRVSKRKWWESFYVYCYLRLTFLPDMSLRCPVRGHLSHHCASSRNRWEDARRPGYVSRMVGWSRRYCVCIQVMHLADRSGMLGSSLAVEDQGRTACCPGQLRWGVGVKTLDLGRDRALDLIYRHRDNPPLARHGTGKDSRQYCCAGQGPEGWTRCLADRYRRRNQLVRI